MKIFGKDLTQETLGKLLQKARETKRDQHGKRISREMLGNAIGVDKQTIYEWERGNKHPGFLSVCKFCDYLGITVDELLGIKQNRYIHLIISEEERDTIFSMVDECEQEPEINNLYKKLHFFKQYIKTLLSRAHLK